ncbi:MAG TPA: MDR family MFS transporter [Candidatus Methylomirabilis sp.]|nr:MDR family MFS transporter [Candidatus Methylomirabilis sp.]
MTRRQIMLVFYGTVLGMMLAALDQTIVATALPAIVADLHGFAHLSWVVTAYLLASTITVPLYGKLSDLFGRKRVFVFAIVLFLIGSALCGLSRSMTHLIVFRGIQGLGAGGVIPLAQAIIGEIFSPRERFRYQGYTGSLFAASSIVGPLLGGYLTDAVSWRAAFYVNLPLGALALVVIITTMKIPFERRERPIDVLGAMLLSGWVSLCLLVTMWSGTAVPADTPKFIVAVAAGVLLLAAFVAVEFRAPEPILSLRLFRNSIFTVANSAALVIGACRLTVTIYIPVFLQGVIGTSATNSGVVLIPFMLAWIASGIVAGQMVTRTGRYRVWPISGSITSLIGFALLSQLNANSSPAFATVCMVLIGAGMGQMFQTYVVAMQNAVPRSSLGIATASIQFFRTIGSMFGAAVFGSILTRRLTTELSMRLGEAATQVSPGALLSGTMRVADVPPQTVEAVRDSLASALHTAFLGGLPLMGLGLVAALMLKELPLRTTSYIEEPD